MWLSFGEACNFKGIRTMKLCLFVVSSSTFPAFPVGEQKCSKQLSQWETDNSVSRSQKCWKTCIDSQGEFPNTRHKIQSLKLAAIVLKLMNHLRSWSSTEFTECISNLDLLKTLDMGTYSDRKDGYLQNGWVKI